MDVDIVDNANITGTTCRWRRCGLGDMRAAWAGTGGEQTEVGPDKLSIDNTEILKYLLAYHPRRKLARKAELCHKRFKK